MIEALSPWRYGLGSLSGAMVGFVLGLVGGGGSLLAVPLMVYLVGVREPHVAIGTSALAVAVNAAIGVANHARGGTVKWRIVGLFALCGVIGAYFGSTLGQVVDGDRLLGLFALLMVVVGVLMLRQRPSGHEDDVMLDARSGTRLGVAGLATGGLSGFFGIGGGFLIVPALIYATGMPIRHAVGSSLVAVAAFGLTAALNYAAAGWVDWILAGAFIAGGAVGGIAGARAGRALSERKGALNRVFAGLIFVVAAYMIHRSAGALGLGA